MRHFCTYLDQRFLPRTLALYSSMRRHLPSFRLWVLCLDKASETALSALQLEFVSLVGLEELETRYPQLLKARADRPEMEYYLTLTPFLPACLMETRPGIGEIVFIDSDMYFFSDPEPVYRALQGISVGVTEHRFSSKVTARWTRFNDGWIYFKNDEPAAAVLKWWGEKCVEHCDGKLEEGRFYEQKYLDAWPELFSGVGIIPAKGLNLAPWNLANYRVSLEGGCLMTDGEPVVCYHFSGLRELAPGFFETGLIDYKVVPSRAVRESIYREYLYELLAAEARLDGLGMGRSIGQSALRVYRPSFIKNLRRLASGLMRRQLAFAVGRRVII